jgi:2-polyprenyl-3-methyl-5-hydroxy-6-metoxy-1,4-benzoquinol methylase
VSTIEQLSAVKPDQPERNTLETVYEIRARPGHHANVIELSLPALRGVAAKLERGARVADIDCGHGAATILMARAYPGSTFVGFDPDAASIKVARERAREAGLARQVAFRIAAPSSYEGSGFDLVTMFDRLHDLEDPVGVARHVRDSLAPDGTWMIVEPAAVLALSGRAGERHLLEAIATGGFGAVRRVAATPLNLVLEARP